MRTVLYLVGLQAGLQDFLNRGEKSHPECGWHHFMGWALDHMRERGG